MLPFKNKSFIFCLLVSSFTSNLFASVDVLMPLDEFSSKLYNSLPEVEVANANIQSKKDVFDEFLEEASNLAKDSNFDELVGLRLIHRHHTLGDNEVMAEGYELFEEEEALVTRSVKVDDLSEYTPSSWIYSDDKLQVFEYSKDQRVKNGYKSLQENTSFLSSFLDLLQQYEMQSLVSFAILDREWYERLNGEIYFNENSYDSDNSFFSVVLPKEDRLEDSSRDYIKTAWTINSPVSVANPFTPYTYGCVPQGYRCVSSSFGHRNTKVHGYK